MDQEVNIIRIENWKRLIQEANNSGLSKTFLFPELPREGSTQ